MKNRHLKSKRKRTWTNLRVEIKQICEEFKIHMNEFSEVNINHWKEIENKIWGKFSTHKNLRWIWQTLKEDYSAVAIDYDKFELENLINPKEKIWFLFEETVKEKTKFWIYEGTIKGFNKVFWETSWMDEVIMVSKKYEWIFIINHHDIMIGTGEMKNKIEK